MKFCPQCFAEYEDDVLNCHNDQASLSGIEQDPLIGICLADRYEILSVIGRGGMGIVYKARHGHLDRVVAIKMLHSHLVSDSEALKRFHREAKAIARVKHPHTVCLYDFGISPSGQPYLVMDFVQGISLKQVLKEGGPLPLERVESIFQQVVEALFCAHQEGVIHRDLKPENIMLTEKDTSKDWVCVVDFGISKLKGRDNQTLDNITRIGDVCGSPPYMSPEQCLASVPVDARSDIYSMAIVIYEALSGNLPFKARTAVEMIDCHLYANPTPLKAQSVRLSYCEDLNNLLNKALQKDPDRRHASMEEFGFELKEAISKDILRLKSAPKETSTESGQRDVEHFQEPSVIRLGRFGDTQVMAEDLVNQQRQTVSCLSAVPQKTNWLKKIKETVYSFYGLKGTQAASATGLYLLAGCPYCQATVKNNIRFCLECGHNLPSSQELTQLRMSQRVFSLPKANKSIADKPEFSKQARAVLGRPPGELRKVILLLDVLLALILCLFFLLR